MQGTRLKFIPRASERESHSLSPGRQTTHCLDDFMMTRSASQEQLDQHVKMTPSTGHPTLGAITRPKKGTDKRGSGISGSLIPVASKLESPTPHPGSMTKQVVNDLGLSLTGQGSKMNTFKRSPSSEGQFPSALPPLTAGGNGPVPLWAPKNAIGRVRSTTRLQLTDPPTKQELEEDEDDLTPWLLAEPSHVLMESKRGRSPEKSANKSPLSLSPSPTRGLNSPLPSRDASPISGRAKTSYLAQNGRISTSRSPEPLEMVPFTRIGSTSSQEDDETRHRGPFRCLSQDRAQERSESDPKSDGSESPRSASKGKAYIPSNTAVAGVLNIVSKENPPRLIKGGSGGKLYVKPTILDFLGLPAIKPIELQPEGEQSSNSQMETAPMEMRTELRIGKVGSNISSLGPGSRTNLANGARNKGQGHPSHAVPVPVTFVTGADNEAELGEEKQESALQRHMQRVGSEPSTQAILDGSGVTETQNKGNNRKKFFQRSFSSSFHGRTSTTSISEDHSPEDKVHPKKNGKMLQKSSEDSGLKSGRSSPVGALMGRKSGSSSPVGAVTAGQGRKSGKAAHSSSKEKEPRSGDEQNSPVEAVADMSEPAPKRVSGLSLWKKARDAFIADPNEETEKKVVRKPRKSTMGDKEGSSSNPESPQNKSGDRPTAAAMKKAMLAKMGVSQSNILNPISNLPEPDEAEIEAKKQKEDDRIWTGGKLIKDVRASAEYRRNNAVRTIHYKEVELFVVTRISGLEFIRKDVGDKDEYGGPMKTEVVDPKCQPTLHVRRAKIGEDFIMLSQAYGETPDENGHYSIRCTFYDLDNKKNIPSSYPERACRHIQNGLAVRPGGMVWSDRVNTFLIYHWNSHEVAERKHRNLREVMGGMYLCKMTLSELLFNDNPLYWIRGWVAQEFNNSRLIVRCLRFSTAKLRRMMQVLEAGLLPGNLWENLQGWKSDLVAEQSGKEGAKEKYNKWLQANGVQNYEFESYLEDISELRDILHRHCGILKDGPEFQFVHQFVFQNCFQKDPKPGKSIFIPDRRSLAMLRVRRNLHASSQLFRFEMLSGEETKHASMLVLCATEPPTLEQLLNLKHYNTLNLYTEFVDRTDCHEAIYGTIEYLTNNFVHDEDKAPDLHSAYIPKMAMPKVAEFLCGQGKNQINVPLSGDGSHNTNVSLLMMASKHRNWDLVEQLLGAGAEVNCMDDLQVTPLILAFKAGKKYLAKQLLAMGADPNLGKDSSGKKLLHLVAADGSQEFLEELFQRVKNVNCQDGSERVPLHYAAAHGHEETARRLLERKADPDMQDKSGLTALHFAAESGNNQIVQSLLAAQADPEVVEDKADMSALHFAAEAGHADVVQTLLEQQADPTGCNAAGRTPLHNAAKEGHVEVVVLLLQCEIDVNAVGSSNKTSLHLACQEGHEAVVNKMLEKEVNLNIRDKDGMTCLHCAAFQGYPSIIRALLENHAEVDAKDYQGRAALHWAAKNGHHECVVELFKFSAAYMIADKAGCTPFDLARLGLTDRDSADSKSQLSLTVDILNEVMLKQVHDQLAVMIQLSPEGRVQADMDRLLQEAVSIGEEDAVSRLLQVKADPNTRDRWNRTPLIVAAQEKYAHVTRLLLKHQANPNEPAAAQSRETKSRPLHIACSSGQVSMVQDLLSAKADVNAKDQDGLTPFALAERSGKPIASDLKVMLKQAGALVS